MQPLFDLPLVFVLSWFWPTPIMIVPKSPPYDSSATLICDISWAGWLC
jgi:hypothetical protein